MRGFHKLALCAVCVSVVLIAKVEAKPNDEGCDNRRLALSTFVTGCAAWKGVYQTNRGDNFAKQKSDCRDISKEFSSLIFGVAPKTCEFTYETNLIKALMQDKDIRAFADSL